MKHLFLLIALLLSFQGFSQNKLSPAGRIFFQELQALIIQQEGTLVSLPNNFQQRYDLTKRGAAWYIGALVLVDANFDENALNGLAMINGEKMASMYCVQVRLQDFQKLIILPGIQYIECGSGIEPNLERVRQGTHVDSVQMGLGNLQMPYRGKDVVIAVIDWGFDYTHPVFYDSLLQNYRVKRAWDQNKTSGPAPAGFNFGTEYLGKDELLAAEEDTLYVFGPGSHATHVSGIAGGAGAQTKYWGMAPEADLVFISLRRDDASFVAAVNYIHNYAKSVGKRYVVNMSIGNHSGPHDGSTLRNRAMDSLAMNGGVFVASAGNNGGETFHLQRDFSSPDTLITEVARANGLSNYWGESVNIWADSGKSFSVQLELCDANYTPLYQSAWYATQDMLALSDTLYQLDGDTLLLRLVSEEINFLNGKPNLLFESRNLGNNKVILRVKGSGNTHLWHVAQLNNRVSNWGQPFKAGYPGAVQGDGHYGVGGPPGVGKKVITVASYLAEATLPNGNTALGTLSSYSSEGPTPDERQKPDITAPGESVLSSVNSHDPNPGNVQETVVFNGITYSFVRYSGTSMSSPATAGIVALILQANRFLTSEDIKEILRASARLDKNTGAIGPNGDLFWGYGKVNAYAAVRMAEIRTGNQRIMEHAPFAYYPNPVSQRKLTIESEKNLSIRIIDMQGKEMQCEQIEAGTTSLNLSTLPSGAYLLEWQSGNEGGFEKLILP